MDFVVGKYYMCNKMSANILDCFIIGNLYKLNSIDVKNNVYGFFDE